MSGRFIIGVDVGGTFTDILCLDMQSGKFCSSKVPSDAGEQWRGVLASLRQLSIPVEDVGIFVHGTTIATNALLERKGARTALVTTKGFRDTLEIGKTRRLIGGLFDSEFQRPKPLVDRRHRYEAQERLDSLGQVISELDDDELRQIAQAIEAEGIEAVAIGFLNSYLNDSHEQRARSRLAAFLSRAIPICTSSEISRERGEFERFSTATVNAYLAPTVGAYLDHLTEALRSESVNAQVQLMSSNGGFLSLDAARRFPVRTFLSGPVGGIIGAKQIAGRSDVTDFITFDMGGTSTDVALVAGSMPSISFNNLIDAYPLQVPQLDIHTIGAGGGSIARLGADGSLDVGPHSAGAYPGPAAYQRGGKDVTITDANVVLGRLPAGTALGNTIKLSMRSAEHAFSRLVVSQSRDVDHVLLAEAIVKIAVAKMAGAVREVSVHRGHDPRDFHLLGFGGAGPMHVFLVAEELGVTKVLIPRFPGHLSAMGQILADFVVHLSHPFRGRFDSIDETHLREAMRDLRNRARTEFAVEEGADVNEKFRADVRYRGQSFTLSVEVGGTTSRAAIDAAFHKKHQAIFGHSTPSGDIEILGLRLTLTMKRRLPGIEFDAGDLKPEAPIVTQSYWNGDWLPTKVLAREHLPAGYSDAGPLIIQEQGATTVLPPGWRVRVDRHGNLHCEFTERNSSRPSKRNHDIQSVTPTRSDRATLLGQ